MTNRPSTLAIYCGDAGYLFPMLVSARSLRAHASAANFDIRIFAIDLTPDTLARARDFAATFGAEVVAMDSSAYEVFPRAQYDAANTVTYLAPSALARLVTGRFIEPTYERVLYIDGDTLCVGDFSPLAALPVPAGKMFATPDPANYWRFDAGPVGVAKNAYMRALGVGADETYYNSGVIYADRAAWAEAGEAALRFFAANMALCDYKDQSALNATARERFLPMSARWNFTQPMRAWGLDGQIDVRLYHFSGPEKPWRGRLLPWTIFSAQYAAFAREPALAPFVCPPAPSAELAAFNRASRIWAAKARTIQLPRWLRARRAVLAREHTALV